MFVEKHYSGIHDTHDFKTKKEALKFAYDYMKEYEERDEDYEEPMFPGNMKRQMGWDYNVRWNTGFGSD